MLRDDVEIRGRYIAKVSGKVTVVRVICAHQCGRGWTAVNCLTNVRIHIRSAQRLRRAVSEKEWEDQWKTLVS